MKVLCTGEWHEVASKASKQYMRVYQTHQPLPEFVAHLEIGDVAPKLVLIPEYWIVKATGSAGTSMLIFAESDGPANNIVLVPTYIF